MERVNDNISKGLWQHEISRSVLDKELDNIDRYNDEIRRYFRLFERRVSLLCSSSSNNSVSNQIKLPQLPLPQYSHAPGEFLETFFRNYDAIVPKYAISEYEKFVFLEKRLSGEPLILIKSLQGAQQSYAEARSLLESAFASPLLQKYDIINRLSKLKLLPNRVIYAFISEMRVIISKFTKLKIDVNTILVIYGRLCLKVYVCSSFILQTLIDLVSHRLKVKFLRPLTAIEICQILFILQERCRQWVENKLRDSLLL